MKKRESGIDRERFAFIAHPRDEKELYRNIPILRMLGRRMREKLISSVWPLIVVEMKTNLTTAEGKRIVGDLVTLTQTPGLIFKNLRKVRARVRDAVQLGRNRGARSIGLGALLPAAVSGGKWLEKELDVHIATGSSFNAWIMIENLKQSAQRLSIDLASETLCIIGASQQTGVNVAHSLSGFCSKVILSDVPGKKGKLESLKRDLLEVNNRLDVRIECDPAKLTDSSLFMVFTSAQGVLPPVELLRPGTLMLDDTQPRSISREYEQSREDLIVMEGGVIRLPGFNPGYRMGLRNKDEMYGCVAETILMTWLESHGEDPSSVDYFFNPDTAKEAIDRAVERTGFCLTEPRSRGQVSLTHEKVAAFRKAKRTAIAV